MFERIVRIISKYTEAEDITPASALMGDLGLSSFDVVSIVSEFEEEFDIEVEDRDIPGFVTVSDIQSFLEERT